MKWFRGRSRLCKPLAARWLKRGCSCALAFILAAGLFGIPARTATAEEGRSETGSPVFEAAVTDLPAPDSSEEAPAPSLRSAAPSMVATTQALAKGTTFRVSSDEGRGVVYTVLDPDARTCALGGSYGAEQPTTVDYSFAGPLTIPSTVTATDASGAALGTFVVTEVAAGAFGPYTLPTGVTTFCNVTSLRLPATVQSIGTEAFKGAHRLETVEFAGSSALTTIAPKAFQNSGLLSFTVPDKVTSIGAAAFIDSDLRSIQFKGTGVTTIPSQCFEGTALTDLDFLPSSITAIGENAFANSELVSAHLPNHVSSLGDGLFYRCLRLEEASIEDGTLLRALPPYTYAGCAALASYEVSSWLTSIEQEAFAESGLESITIPTNITYIDEAAFSDCSKLASVSFAAGHELMYIQPRLFANCTALTQVDLPVTIRRIDQEAFAGCTALQRIDIPKACTQLGASAFYNCTALDTLVFNGDARYLVMETSTFFRDNKLKKVVFRGKKCPSIDLYMPSALPTYYYTLGYYGSKSEALKSGTQIGHYSLAAGKVPATASSTFRFDGSYLASPAAGSTWIYEPGFSPQAAITDSFYAYRYNPEEELAVGATFTALTIDGVKVTYTVETVASEDGRTLGRVMVGYKDTIEQKAAIDKDTAGAVTIPETVIGTDGRTYQVDCLAPNAFYDCGSIIQVTIPATATQKPSGKGIGKNAFAKCKTLRNVCFEGDLSGWVDNQWFLGCGNIKSVVYGGKKTSISFGTSSPAFSYTVRYYNSKSAMDADEPSAVLIVRERALLGNLGSSDVTNGARPPELRVGYEWVYEAGFGPAVPLTDSTSLYQSGVGFQVDITISGSSDYSKASCWFSVIEVDEAKKTGTCRVGLGKDVGDKAIHTAVNGTPFIPSTVTYEGITYTVTEVGDYAFGSTQAEYACSYIQGMTLPTTVKRIGTAAFANCRDLALAIIPAQIYEMGEGAYKDCSSLSLVNFRTGSLLTTLPQGAFQGTSSLKTIILPDSLATIGASAFADTGLPAVDFPATLKTISDSAFESASLRGEVSFPPSVQTFGQRAFADCRLIETLLFTGNASKVAFGTDAFALGVGSAFNYVTFWDKRNNDIAKYLKPLDSRGAYKSYKIYTTVSFYDSNASYNRGAVSSRLVFLANNNPTRTQPLSGQVPLLAKDCTWTYEPGFDLDEIAYDSFYCIAGKDISKATITFPQSSYYLTGTYITPAATVRWSDGTVLRAGTDYTADITKGSRRDGYTNNLTNGTAQFHIVGQGNYAGYAFGSFRIVNGVDPQGSFSITLDTVEYEYDGKAKTPGLSVTAQVLGDPYPVTPGQDYDITYRNNVNAGSAQAVVVGKNLFPGETSAAFSIRPISLYDCTVSGMVDSVKAADSQISEPQLTIVNPYGVALRKNKDYEVGVVNYGFGTGSIYVTGLGNYTDTLVSNIGYGGEGGGDGLGGNGSGGSGGGHGSGDGTGDGFAAGTGNARRSADGASMLAASNALTSDTLAQEAGSGGWSSDSMGEGSASKRFFELLNSDSDFVLDAQVVSYLNAILLVLAVAFGLGALGRAFTTPEAARHLMRYAWYRRFWLAAVRR